MASPTPKRVSSQRDRFVATVTTASVFVNDKRVAGGVMVVLKVEDLLLVANQSSTAGLDGPLLAV